MSDYDVIVVGARVAGAPTAMLLAKHGHRVLLVDRARFPSDTVSTHLIHPPGMAALARWGLAERVIASGPPPVTTYSLDPGTGPIAGRPRGTPTAPFAYAPRRTALDAILVEAAAAAGVEVRQGVTVDELIVEDGAVRGLRGRSGGRSLAERAPIVVGADGVRSFVADAVGADRYVEVPPLAVLYYGYWSGLPIEGEFSLFTQGRRGFGHISTADGLTIVAVAWPMDEFEANRHDVAGNYRKATEAHEELRERLAQGRLESRIFGQVMVNHYRQSFGPGWALVGDAGYVKDATTAQGIGDAFADAESLADAIDDGLGGRRPLLDTLADHQAARDARTRPMFELSVQFAEIAPPSDDDAALFAAVAADPKASEDLLSVLAGTMPVEAFFDPANLGRLLGEAVA
jgi:2-polyprenyl-6-methoxyphenol hydroxylase-like FAD-dependent oxidoreductase